MIKVGNYELYKDDHRFLGKGAFSEVYLGKYIGESSKYITTGKEVAIKIIKTNNLTEKAKSIIEDEINIMEIIKDDPHPNIVECYDILKMESKIYIILEYCDSKDLRTIIRKPIKESYTQFYFSQLANGLKYLDQKNIIHRDIKPKNILLTNSRRVLKIADFGFARQAKEQNLYETMCGSPLYMAPEITGNNYYNKQTDLWSIGMILYEMLYGFHPFHKCKSMPELKDKIDKTEIKIPPPDNTNKDVSEEYISLVKRLLQKDVKDRITWTEFFEHPWINKYQYINIGTNKKNEDYEEQICSVSLGSLTKNISINDKLSESPSSVNMIENYLDNPSSTEDLKEVSGIEKIKSKSNGLIEGQDDDCIFDIELDGSSKNSVMICRGIIDTSSILEPIDENSHRYEIIDNSI